MLTFSVKPVGPDAVFSACLYSRGTCTCWVKFCIHLLSEIARFVIALHFVLLITTVLLIVLSEELSCCAGS